MCKGTENCQDALASNGAKPGLSELQTSKLSFGGFLFAEGGWVDCPQNIIFYNCVCNSDWYSTLKIFLSNSFC